ncbi:MAG TPA: HAD-IB family phosphatase [Opitutaceae bacterium]
MKLICFDCDSTLSSVEGIDELARLRGPDIFATVEALTNDAMNGLIRIEDIFKLRLEAIRPSVEDAASIGRRYLATVEPTAKATVDELKALGWTCVIISGGFRQAIRPLADFLGIDRIEAVDLFFGPDGAYRGFDEAYPSTRSGGKVDIIAKLRREMGPDRVVMIGDGVSDLETQPVVDLFVGFGGYAPRELVKRKAQAFVTSLAAVTTLV